MQYENYLGHHGRDWEHRPVAGLGQGLFEFGAATIGIGTQHSWFGGRPITGRGLTLEAFLRARGVPNQQARATAREFEKRFDNPPSWQGHDYLRHWQGAMQWGLSQLPPPPVSKGEWDQMVDQLGGEQKGIGVAFTKNPRYNFASDPSDRWMPLHLRSAPSGSDTPRDDQLQCATGMKPGFRFEMRGSGPIRYPFPVPTCVPADTAPGVVLPVAPSEAQTAPGTEGSSAPMDVASWVQRMKERGLSPMAALERVQRAQRGEVPFGSFPAATTAAPSSRQLSIVAALALGAALFLLK